MVNTAIYAGYRDIRYHYIIIITWIFLVMERILVMYFAFLIETIIKHVLRQKHFDFSR